MLTKHIRKHYVQYYCCKRIEVGLHTKFRWRLGRIRPNFIARYASIDGRASIAIFRVGLEALLSTRSALSKAWRRAGSTCAKMRLATVDSAAI